MLLTLLAALLACATALRAAEVTVMAPDSPRLCFALGKAQWIWNADDDGESKHHVCWLRKTFTLEASPVSALAAVTADTTRHAAIFSLVQTGSTVANPPDAAFVDLRAQDGLLVSTEQKSGRIGRVAIKATVAETARVLNPWPDQPVVAVNSTTGRQVPGMSYADRVLTFRVSAGQRYHVQPVAPPGSSASSKDRAQ